MRLSPSPFLIEFFSLILSLLRYIYILIIDLFLYRQIIVTPTSQEGRLYFQQMETVTETTGDKRDLRSPNYNWNISITVAASKVQGTSLKGQAERFYGT